MRVLGTASKPESKERRRLEGTSLNETYVIFRGETEDTMKDNQQYFKYDTRFFEHNYSGGI